MSVDNSQDMGCQIRHDICHKDYATAVLRTGILRKNLRKCFKMAQYGPIEIEISILILNPIISVQQKKRKSGSSFFDMAVTRRSLLLFLVTKFHLGGIWIFLKNTCTCLRKMVKEGYEFTQNA